MQSFFIAFSNFISNIWSFLVDLFTAFHNLLSMVNSQVSFIMKSLAMLPDLVRIPCTIILGVMIIKFVLSFGKQ